MASSSLAGEGFTWVSPTPPSLSNVSCFPPSFSSPPTTAPPIGPPREASGETMSTDIEAMTRVVPSRAVSSPVSSSSVNLLRATCHLRPLKTAEGTRRYHSGLSGEPCAKAAPAVALEQREGRSLHRATSGATLARLAVVLGGHPQRGGGVSRSLASDHRTRPPASHFQGFPWNSSCRTSL